MLPKGKFSTILADPPWHFKVRSSKGAGRSASQHYDTMSLDDIKAMPVADIAEKDCALFMWATDPMLPEALETIKAWGFTYKTVGFYWAKTNMVKDPEMFPGYFTGMGYWSRANIETCFLATRGNPQRLAADVRRLIIAPRREHSRKPDAVYEHIERLVPGPYCELFARTVRPGWTAWGNEVEKFAA